MRSAQEMCITSRFTQLRIAANNRSRVDGLTHNFYRYPARFSPQFAATAIKCFSNPGDLVLDPYMGGGTTIVEAISAGRQAVGIDLNSLAVFVARVKTTPLRASEIRAVHEWATQTVPLLSFRAPQRQVVKYFDDGKTKNLNVCRARFIRKIIACALSTIDALPSTNSRNFTKCVLLRVGQWALDGRKQHTSLSEFRAHIAKFTTKMLSDLNDVSSAIKQLRENGVERPNLAHHDATAIPSLSIFAKKGRRADLVLTSPPYPGVHVLYHRWQVDGRRETPAPYWITGTQDGQRSSFYNFGDRHDPDATDYFATSFRTLVAIREVMKYEAVFIQLLAFNNPRKFLPRYLNNMTNAGFAEIKQARRIWRKVPNRRWHACAKGNIPSSREVVLIHRAV